MKLSRTWQMPNHNTLSIKPIRKLVEKYLKSVSVDPFARDCEICEITNDLNPSTKAKYHMKAEDFLRQQKEMGFVLFDPPYSLRQVKECYEGVGTAFTQHDSQNAIRWTDERNIISLKQNPDDIVISLGWSSTCMGMSRGYEIVEILLVSHGPAHSDTICVVEVKK